MSIHQGLHLPRVRVSNDDKDGVGGSSDSNLDHGTVNVNSITSNTIIISTTTTTTTKTNGFGVGGDDTIVR